MMVMDRSRRASLRSLPLLVAGFAAGAAQHSVLDAQEVTCSDNMTLESCYVALREPIDSAFAAENRAREVAQLNAKTSGAPAMGGASAIDDFLPLLAGSLGLEPVETDEDGAVALETNLGLPTGLGAHQRVRARVTVRRARIYESLRGVVGEDVLREAEDRFGTLDDVEVGVAWNVETRSVGRAFRNYQVLYGRLLDDALGDPLDDAGPALTELLQELAEGGALADCGASITLACLPPGRRGEVLERLQDLATADALFGERAAALVRDQGLDWFARLVNNQPQFRVEATARIRRDDLIGPETYGIGIRYEHGIHNVNRLRGFCADSGNPVVELPCLRGYLDQSGVRQSIDRGDRLWGAVRFEQIADYDATLDAVTVEIGGSWDLIVEAGFGRYLGVGADGEELGRLDFSLEGHLVNDESGDRENRIVFNADLGRRLADGVSLVLGFSAANEPRFIGGGDDKVSVRAAMRYGLH